MAKRIPIVSLVALTIAAAPAFAGAIRIDFSGGPNTAAGGNPAWRVSNQAADPSNISETLEVGSASTTDGLGYLRITQSTAGPDVLGYIVVIPRMLLDNAMMLADGVGVDRYGVKFANGRTTVPGGFQIYLPTDRPLDCPPGGLGCVGPAFTADITLNDQQLVTLGSTGSLEANVTVNLTNPLVFLPTASLSQLAAAMGGGRGADFVANVSSAGNDLSNKIRSNATVLGSASGSIFAVPEPGTFILLVAGGVMALRARRTK